jgi:hypothetical protein
MENCVGTAKSAKDAKSEEEGGTNTAKKERQKAVESS